ncbi:MAG: UDP binding domain-containing protein, partial [Nitrosopumilaceae archaeon]
FKPGTDDLRSSPAIEGIKILQQKGAKISAYDPKITPELISEFGITNIVIHKKLEECLMNSVLAILFTKWPEFKDISSDFLSRYMVQPLIIDGRGYLDKNNFKKNTYYKVGYVE